jgi:hypothetical protein
MLMRRNLIYGMNQLSSVAIALREVPGFTQLLSGTHFRLVLM